MRFTEADKIWVNELSRLNEVQRRRLAAAKAIELGRGGVTKVCKLTKMSHNTIDKGIKEVRTPTKYTSEDRLRKEGGGRKKITNKNPKIEKEIEEILDENTAGDPMSKLKWTNKSTYTINQELQSKGFGISEDTIGRIIKNLGYSLQGNRKSKENGNTQERDLQFRYINQEVKRCDKYNIPVISVDAKKKELVGNFKNNGRVWLKKGKAEIVNVYDYANLSIGKAIPYGIYDVLKNNGFVNIGVSGNTAEFAVESIYQWWKKIGVKNYKNAKELLICADSGGGNSNRNRFWKYCLYEFAKQNKLKVTVCHYPAGTSKWNKIEHRMFSFISMNWKGKPLRTYEIVLNLIEGTKTKTGLKISARLDKHTYETGKEITDEEFAKVKITPNSFNPNWNYALN